MVDESTSPTIRIKPGSQRATRFQIIFGRLDRIPVVHTTPHTVTDKSGDHLAYELNVPRLTSTEFNALVSYYADLMNQMPDRVRNMLRTEGVPLLADDCEVEHAD